MSTIDDRVVRMRFDTAQFESRAQSTIGLLGRLKQALRLDGAQRGFEEIDRAGRNLKLDHIGQSVDTIANRFSAMGIVAITALQNITNRAIAVGGQLLKSLTIDPIMDGFREYETQIGSIQTILANTSSKGTNLTQVNAALDELNTYADKTIYNFTEMTRNIGTFTAAGVGLKDSVSSIKGIANLAALSGSNSQQASTAMYQLSQAIASGTVKLMDWNSVVNAGMGGEIFQNELKRTARAHGVAVDALIKKQGSFRESLSEGWLSAKILNETLAKFAGEYNEQQLRSMGYTAQQAQEILKLGQMATDAATKVRKASQLIDTLKEAVQSGWSQTWRLIIGDFEEATQLWTGISDFLGDIINKSSDARNKLIAGWKELGGRTALLQTLKNVFWAIVKPITALGKAFKELFPGPTAKALADFTKTLARITGRLVLTDKAANDLKRTFKGLLVPFHLAIHIATGLVRILGSVASILTGGLFKGFTKAGGGLLGFTGRIGDALVKFDQWVVKAQFADKVIAKIHQSVDYLGRQFKMVGRVAKEHFGSFASKLPLGPIKADLVEVGNQLKTFGKRITDVFRFDDIEVKIRRFIEMLRNLRKTIADAMSSDKMERRTRNLGRQIENLSTKMANFATDAYPKAKSGIQSFLKYLNKKRIDLGLTAENVEKLQGVMARFGGFLKNKVGPAVGSAAKSMLSGLKQLGTNLANTDWSNAFLGLGGILSALISFKAIKGLKESFGKIGGVLEAVTGSLQALQQNIKARTILIIAAAVAVLAASLLMLGQVDKDKIGPGLQAIITLFIALNASMAAINKTVGPDFKAIPAAVSILVIAGAIAILASAVKKIAGLDMKGAVTGVIAIGSALGAMVFVMQKLEKYDAKGSLETAFSMLVVAGSVYLMVLAVRKIGQIPTKEAAQGVIITGIILTIIGLFAQLSNEKVNIGNSTSLLIISYAMLQIGKALNELGKLDMKNTLIGVGYMVLSIGAIIQLMNSIKWDILRDSAGLLITIATLKLLAMVIRDYAQIPVRDFAKGLALIAASLVVLTLGLNSMKGQEKTSGVLIALGIALNLLVPVITTLGKLSMKEVAISMAALAGVIFVLVGAGYALSPVIGVLFAFAIVLGIMGAAALAAGAGMALLGIGLTAAAAGGGAAIGVLILAIKEFVQLLPMIAVKAGEAFIAFLGVIQQHSPQIGATMLALINQMLSTIEAAVPRIIDIAFKIIMHFLRVLDEHMPELVDRGLNIILSLLRGIRDHIFEITTVSIDIVTRFIDGIGSRLGQIIDAGVRLILNFINGVTNAINNYSSEMGAAGGRLAIAIIQGMANGLASGAGVVVDAAVSMARNALASAKRFLGIESPSKEFRYLGVMSAEGMAQGIELNSNKPIKGAIKMASDVVQAVNDELVKMADDPAMFRPKVVPVLDLSDVEKGMDHFDYKPKHPAPVYAAQSSGKNSRGDISTEQSGTTQNVHNEYKFEQTINSPTELSPYEVYRHTRNEFRRFRDAMERT